MRRLASLGGKFLVLALLCLIASDTAAQSIGLSFTGITRYDGALLNNNAGYAPPDNAGAVGQAHVVQLINGAFAVYDKTNGDPLYVASGRQFWIDAGVDPGIGISNLGAFNQRILYDVSENRWIAAALTADSVDNRVMIARSNTSNPLDGWQAVSFVGNVGGDGRFVDYTALGLDGNGVYVTTNNFASIAGGLDSVSVFSVPKADLLATVPTLQRLTRFDGLISGEQPFVGWTIQPVIDYSGNRINTPMLATGLLYAEDALYRTDLANTASAPASMSLEATSIPVETHHFPPNAAQPDGTRAIGLIDHRFKSQVMQVGDLIYAVHDVLVGANAGIRWYKIDETTNQVIQAGTLSNPNYDYYQASIAANDKGEVVIGFNRSGFGADGQISILAAIGTTAGGITTFADPLLILSSTVSDYHYLNTRWGDYTTTVADPFNPYAFWTFQAYALDSNAWATHITQILIPEPTSYLLAAVALVALLCVGRHRRQQQGCRN